MAEYFQLAITDKLREVAKTTPFSLSQLQVIKIAYNLTDWGVSLVALTCGRFALSLDEIARMYTGDRVIIIDNEVKGMDLHAKVDFIDKVLGIPLAAAKIEPSPKNLFPNSTPKHHDKIHFKKHRKKRG